MSGVNQAAVLLRGLGDGRVQCLAVGGRDGYENTLQILIQIRRVEMSQYDPVAYRKYCVKTLLKRGGTLSYDDIFPEG